MMIIKLYELFGANTLRNRETANIVVKMAIEAPESSQVIIDFDRIEFATRSFLNELLSELHNRNNVTFANENQDIKKMMKISLKAA